LTKVAVPKAARISTRARLATVDIVNGPGRAQQSIFPAGFEGNDGARAAKHHMGVGRRSSATGQTKNRASAGEGVIVVLKQGDRPGVWSPRCLHGLDANAGHAVDGFAGSDLV
jgi:hypothetical protein